jgi:hypothetical protein
MMSMGLVYRSLRAFLWLMYPASVMAAQSTLGDSIARYSLATVGVVVLLICVGGFTGLLHRMKQEYATRGELQHPKLFITSTLMGAGTAGTTALFLGEQFGMTGAFHAVFIIIASYGGTLFLEKLFDYFVGKYMPSTGTNFTAPAPTPAPTAATPPSAAMTAAEKAKAARKAPPTPTGETDAEQP